MLSLEHDQLVIRFPEVHPDAVCTIDFQRTLRIPDDNRTHALPPGLGKFPLAHVDDHAARLPAAWHKRGGVFLPMHQTEAMWIRFHSKYPFAVKIASGKVNAVTGDAWSPELKGPTLSDPRGGFQDLQSIKDSISKGGLGWGGPLPYQGGYGLTSDSLQRRVTHIGPKQDYLSIPKQPWLDGFCVQTGKVRQFVAMPLGSGYTVEEQLTGEAIHGGLQIIVYPLKREFYQPPCPVGGLRGLMPSSGVHGMAYAVNASASMNGAVGGQLCADMGLAPGGLMTQKIHETEYSLEKWDQRVSAKCFVHLLNSEQYKHVTGKEPPHSAPTAHDYTNMGLPWYEEYAPFAKALEGSKTLQKLDSVANLGNKLGEQPLPENMPLAGGHKTVFLGAHTVFVKDPNKIREGEF